MSCAKADCDTIYFNREISYWLKYSDPQLLKPFFISCHKHEITDNYLKVCNKPLDTKKISF